MRFVSRASGTGGSGPFDGLVSDPAFEESFPALFEHCCLPAWEDGSPRRTSTLLFFCEEGSWKVCITDKAAGRVAFVSSRTFQDLLGTLDRMIQEGRLEWRKQKAFPKAR